jgi:hypothetical protein
MNAQETLDAIQKLLEDGDRFPWEIPVEVRDRAVEAIDAILRSPEHTPDQLIAASTILLRMDNHNMEWIRLARRAEMNAFNLGDESLLRDLDRAIDEVLQPPLRAIG